MCKYCVVSWLLAKAALRFAEDEMDVSKNRCQSQFGMRHPSAQPSPAQLLATAAAGSLSREETGFLNPANTPGTWTLHVGTNRHFYSIFTISVVKKCQDRNKICGIRKIMHFKNHFLNPRQTPPLEYEGMKYSNIFISI